MPEEARPCVAFARQIIRKHGAGREGAERFRAGLVEDQGLLADFLDYWALLDGEQFLARELEASMPVTMRLRRFAAELKGEESAP